LGLQLLLEAGLDSLGAAELRKGLGDTFGLDLPATISFDYPSISAMAQHIATLLAAPITVSTLKRKKVAT
jgi:acyl carrier protein